MSAGLKREDADRRHRLKIKSPRGSDKHTPRTPKSVTRNSGDLGGSSGDAN